MKPKTLKKGSQGNIQKLTNVKEKTSDILIKQRKVLTKQERQSNVLTPRLIMIKMMAKHINRNQIQMKLRKTKSIKMNIV